MIPNKSKASIKEGNWYIYNDDINTIQVWSSNLNGNEKVFLNSELVSELRSIKMQSEHKFKDKNGQDYQVIFKTENLLKGLVKCIIIKDSATLKVFKTKLKREKVFTLKRFLIVTLAFIIFWTLNSLYNFYDLIFILFVVILLIIYFTTRKPLEILIEEV